MMRQMERMTGRGRALLALLLVLGLTLAPWQVTVQPRTGAAHPATMSGTWALTGSLPTARGAATAALLPTGQVLVTGGYSIPGGDLASAVEYNPTTGTWATTNSLPFRAEQGTATLLPSGQVLVVAGANLQVATNQAALYTARTGSFTSTGSMVIGRVNFSATLLPTGRVLIAGGCNGSSTGCDITAASADLYDLATGTFTATGSMSMPRQWHTATLLPDGQVLIAGGSPCGACYATASAELYNPQTGTFRLTGSMIYPRSFASATLLPSGQVLVAGGCSQVGGNCAARVTFASAELYNPATGTWHLTGSLISARSMQTATLLPTGQVLVAGGMNNAGIVGGPMSSAELYDPLSGTFTSTAYMNATREFQSATLLPSGQVLVAGGCDNGGGDCGPPILSSAEVYSPLTLTLSLAQGHVGQPFTVSSGAVYSPGEAVSLYWDTPYRRPLLTTTASSTGTISATVTIPLTGRGRHSVIARGWASGTAAYAFVQVVPARARRP